LVERAAQQAGFAAAPAALVAGHDTTRFELAQRVALEPLDIAGEGFAPGDVVILNLSGAGRDPKFFPDPDRFSLERKPPKYDLGFGYGAHYCLGNALAKAEMVEALTVLTRRLRNVELTGPVEVKPTGVICGPEVVPIRFEARA